MCCILQRVFIGGIFQFSTKSFHERHAASRLGDHQNVQSVSCAGDKEVKSAMSKQTKRLLHLSWLHDDDDDNKD